MSNPNTICDQCGKEFYKAPKHKKQTKHNYCSKACYGIACRKPRICPVCKKEFLTSNGTQITCSKACSNRKRTGIKYRTGSKQSKSRHSDRLKRWLIEERGDTCERCGFDTTKILIVHHKIGRDKPDSDELHNLELLCPNCHALIHYG